MIRVVVAAWVRLYRDGLANALGRADGIEVVAAAADERQAVELASALAPDVVVLDTAATDALSVIRDLHAAVPSTSIVALAVPEREDEVLACAEAGASGYVTREASLEDLVAAVRSASSGESLVSPRMAASLLRRLSALAAELARPADAARLTAREVEILTLIDEGLSNKQIALRLHIEVPTVKNHVHHILEKLNVTRRGEAAARLRGPSSLASRPGAGR